MTKNKLSNVKQQVTPFNSGYFPQYWTSGFFSLEK